MILPNMIPNVEIVLVVLLALSLIVSFFYMVNRRGFLSALFWAFVPFRFLLSWASDNDLDDNPLWLDRLQFFLIGTLVLIWLLGKVRT